jgi:uroporphyrin-3 C-methyltransferase
LASGFADDNQRKSIEMAEQISGSGSDKLDVRLNEAFTRLEKQDMNEPKESPRSKPLQVSDSEPGAGSNVASVLAVFLALIAIGMASYPIYHLFGPGVRTTQRALGPLVDEQVALSQTLSARLAAVQTAQSDQARQIQQRLEVLAGQSNLKPEDLDTAVTKLRAEMLALLGTSSQDWLYAEVEYLLRMANQRILMERDAAGARALLQAADEVVRDARGITAFDLRAAIAEDLGQLASVEALDVDGLYLRLMTLIRQVEALPQRTMRYASTDDQVVLERAVDASVAQRFSELLREAGARLSQLVDYRASGVVITPILPPREEYYLRQNLVLQLQMAQIALLRGDQAIYAGALAEAQTWVPAYFDVESTSTRAMMAALDGLAKTDIDRQFPDISASLQVAREHMAKFQQQPARMVAPDDKPVPGVEQ